MSGIFTSVATAHLLRSGELADMDGRLDDVVTLRLDCPGWGLLRIDAVLGDPLSHDRGLHPALVSERFESRYRDPAPVDLKEIAQALAVIRAAEPVCAEHSVAARHERPDLVGKEAHVVGRSHNRPLMTLQAGLDVGPAHLIGRMKQ